MLSISFYSNKKLARQVDISSELFLSLARSEFSKIGKSVTRKVDIDGEVDTARVVMLGKNNREKIIQFLRKRIATEVKLVLSKLGSIPSVNEYQEGVFDLQSLSELLEVVSDENIHLMQRS